MYILLALFFISLAGIIFMVSRKVMSLDGKSHVTEEAVLFKIPHPVELREITLMGVKKYGYLILVISVKAYIKSTGFLKQKWVDLKEKLAEIHQKHILKKETPNARNVSKFLRVVSEYKNKVRKIKEKIEEEEK